MVKRPDFSQMTLHKQFRDYAAQHGVSGFTVRNRPP